MSERGKNRPALEVATGAEFERQVGTMTLSQLEGTGALALMRAVAWHNALVRLGYAVPLVVVLTPRQVLVCPTWWENCVE